MPREPARMFNVPKRLYTKLYFKFLFFKRPKNNKTIPPIIPVAILTRSVNISARAAESPVIELKILKTITNQLITQSAERSESLYDLVLFMGRDQSKVV